MTARSIMVLGVASNVGKSLVAAALCRIFARAGYRVAPFKAQNMSLNSAATPDGGEIGRAQALQAEAAGVMPTTDMNPILIKPESDTGAQIIAQGKLWKHQEAHEYLTQGILALAPIVAESYQRLASAHDLIVLEGAGSPAEINLRDRDLVNMRMAKVAQARCLLVGDIDRGGVFASLFGTLELLEPEERAMFDGFLINKFRGDIALLMPGVRMIEARLGIPCLGVLPYLHGLALDEEDGVAMEQANFSPWPEESGPARRLRIGVLAFPSLSNFTDFAPLAAEPSVALRYLREADAGAGADLLILPGSKLTSSDLQWMRARGFDALLHAHIQQRGLVVGICGGFQMLGQSIHDPDNMEGGGEHAGLSLLPVRTRLTKRKTVAPVQGELLQRTLFGAPLAPCKLSGYEIHIGESEYLDGAQPFATITRLSETQQAHRDGCHSPCGQIFGSYVHGLFQDDAFRHSFLKAARAARALEPPQKFIAWSLERNRQLDRLTDATANAIHLPLLFAMAGLPLHAPPSPPRSTAATHE